VPTKEDNSNARSVDQRFNVFGVLLNFLVTPAETGHEVSLFKGILPPGVVIPLHSHAEPEVFYVLEGSLEVYRESGQPHGWSTTQPGEVLAIPGNVKHALRNTSSTPRLSAREGRRRTLPCRLLEGASLPGADDKVFLSKPCTPPMHEKLLLCAGRHGADARDGRQGRRRPEGPVHSAAGHRVCVVEAVDRALYELLNTA